MRLNSMGKGTMWLALACGLCLAAAPMSAQRSNSTIALLDGPFMEVPAQLMLQHMIEMQEMMKVHGSQGYLGVDIRDVTDEQMSALKLKEMRGAEIVTVDHDAPAGKAGLREHDVVLQVNSQPVEGAEQFRRIMRETPAGRTVALQISRDGQLLTINVQLANRADVERRAWDQHFVPVPPPQDGPGGPIQANGFAGGQPVPTPDAGFGHSFFGTPLMGPHMIYTGAMLEPVGQLAEVFGVKPGVGLLVKNIDPDSPASAAGLKAGDVILRVNATDVVHPDDWVREVRASRGKAMQLTVLRNRQEMTLSLTPSEFHRTRGSLENFVGFGPLLSAR
jgi:membrane-associated protease RseP (regulator of RpoE activity)